jgi:hypothetical protein
MKIVCSWCRREGKTGLVGEKAPFDDARETHGICGIHRHDVEARWQVSVHTTSRAGVATGLSSTPFLWAGLLNVTRARRRGQSSALHFVKAICCWGVRRAESSDH